jgi:protein required for attachment to host cells
MNKTCIIVADGGQARFFGVEEIEAPRVRLALVERAALNNETDLKALGESVTGKVRTETNTNRGSGPVHPMGAQRERHRIELERRFGQEIAQRAAEMTKDWKEGAVVFVAEPRFLGLTREPLRTVLHRGIELKELAKDYVHLTALELHDHLAVNQILPVRRRDKS